MCLQRKHSQWRQKIHIVSQKMQGKCWRHASKQNVSKNDTGIWWRDYKIVQNITEMFLSWTFPRELSVVYLSFMFCRFDSNPAPPVSRHVEPGRRQGIYHSNLPSVHNRLNATKASVAVNRFSKGNKISFQFCFVFCFICSCSGQHCHNQKLIFKTTKCGIRFVVSLSLEQM